MYQYLPQILDSSAFGFMVLSIAVWALSYGFELATTNLREMLFRINFEYVGCPFSRHAGLGLLLCKDFIEKNKGRIWVDSEVDKGSKFFIELPTTGENITVQEQIQAEL